MSMRVGRHDHELLRVIIASTAVLLMRDSMQWREWTAAMMKQLGEAWMIDEIILIAGQGRIGTEIAGDVRMVFEEFGDFTSSIRR